MTVYTAIFGAYEDLKTPKLITPGWEYVCFTDQDFKSDVWKIINVEAENKQLQARYYKLKAWEQWEHSIWIDGSFTINTNLNEWWQKYHKGLFSAPRHPLRNCIYQEGEHCIKINRGSKGIAEQLKEYSEQGVPKNAGQITSGLIMRTNTEAVRELCEKWWQELKTHSIRDQIAFSKVSLGSNLVYVYDWDYRKSKHFIYTRHYHLR